MGTIPPEVLGEIFRLSLPDHALVEEVDGCPDPCTDAEAPLNLQTCRHWRALSIGLQFLWSSIFVCITETGTIKPPLAVIKLWLERSEAQPLFIGLKVHPNAPYTVSEDIDDVVGLFTAHLQRWKCVHLYIPFRNIPSPLQLRKDAETPLLTTIDTNIADSEEEALEYSPHFVHSVEHIRLFSYLEVDLALSWLKVCSNVRDFEIESVRRCEYILDHVLHDKVRSLTFHDADDHLQYFFDCLTLPALEMVDITCAARNMGFVPGFGGLVERSQCNLRRLVLDSTSLSEDQLITLLDSIPSLLHFEIIKNWSVCVQDRFMNVLAAGKICPHLQVLSLGASTLKCTDGVLGNMVKARRPYTFPSGIDISSAGHLQSFGFGLDELWLQSRPKDKAALDLAVIGGLRVKFRGIPYVIKLEL